MGSAAPVIIAVVAVAASVVAGPEMGAAILGYADSIEAVAAGYSVSTLSAVGAAASGAAAGAITEAQKSGDPTKILEAAGVGAVSGAVGSEVGGAVGGATESPILGSTAGGATSGFTKAELGGSNLQSALRQGAVGGITGAAGSLLFPTDATSDSADKAASTVGKTFLGQQVASMLAPTATTSSMGGAAQTAGAGGSAARGAVSGPSGYGDTSTGGGGVGSQALSQVLNLGSPTSAYSDTGAGGEQTSPETGGKPQNVWNLASLRVKDATGGEA